MTRPLRSRMMRDIPRLYNQGLSTRKVAVRCGVSQFYVCCTMRRLGIALRDPIKARRVLAVDESAFDRLTEFSAYWVGFLMADGGIVNNRVCLSLQTRDKGHLRAFKNFLKSAHPIRKNRGVNTWRIIVSSRALVNRLFVLGVTPRKSFTAKAPKILSNNRHFWRGVIDGDGHISVDCRQRLTLGLTSFSPSLMRQYRLFLASILGGQIAEDGTVQSGRALTALDALYGRSKIALARKLALYRELSHSAKKTHCLSCGEIFIAVTERYLFCDVTCQRRYPWKAAYAAMSS